MTELFSHIRTITSPVDRSMLRPLEGETVVQFPAPLTPREYGRVAKLVARHPHVTLRAYGSKFHDVEFLEQFPMVRRFQVDYAYRVESLEGLRHLSADLESLALGETKSPRQFSLTLLRQFPSLRTLYLEKHTKDIEVLGELEHLEDLTLRSITLPDLSILAPLEHLRSLDLKLGGTNDLALLPQIGRLRYLELWQIRGLEDLSPVADLVELQYLFLQSLTRVTALPDLRRLTKLRRVVIDTLKNLGDLTPLRDAPALEQLLLVAMRHIRLEDLECLVGHPTLREAVFGLGSLKRNAAAMDLVGVEPVTTDFEFV